MYLQGKNKNPYVDQFGVPISQKPNIIDNTIKGKNNTVTQNHLQPKIENIKNTNKMNIKNIGYDNKKPANLSHSQNNQIFEDEIYYDETYMIDPNTGKKIILEKKPSKANAQFQQNNLKNIPQKNQRQSTTYQPQLQTNSDITGSTIQDITSSIDPTMENIQRTQKTNEKARQEQNSPIIEYYVDPKKYERGYNKQNNIASLDPNKSASLLTVSSLANIPYKEYPKAEFSKQPFFNISGYGYNSYNGKVKKFNEDRIKAIVNYHIKKQMPFKLNISYFSIFDGHSGNKCSDFLKENLDGYLFNSSFFPSDVDKAVRESFKKAEDNFRGMVYDPKSNILLDKSGSCALVMLIINDYLFSINLGDSRALYSYDSGKYIYQITRDHKPNDEIEKRRIEKAGGKVFYANTINRNGKEIELKEEHFGKGFTFPYRISPGKIAVSYYIII
jgi:hypothetical protein